MAISNDDLYVLQQGDTKYNITYAQLKENILAGSVLPIISTTAPTPAQSTVGQFWWDSDVGQLYIYYEDPTGDKYWVNASTPGLPNASRVTVSPTPPSNPESGMLWWKDDAGVMYVYYIDPSGDQYWVDTNPAGNPVNAIATANTLGEIKVGTGLSVTTDGTLSVTGVSSTTVTDALTALKTQAATATDLDELKTAIANALSAF